MIPDPSQKALLAFAVGVAGAVAILARPVLEMEENAGLDLLFQLRGRVEAPASVAIVSIDEEAARVLGLPLNSEQWPRSLHAEAVRRLQEAGAAVIVFDIYFTPDRQTLDDPDFAAAIREARNVLLLEWIETETIGADGGRLVIEMPVLPIAPFADAALGTAPFPLPTYPIEISQFWLFGRADADAITMPAAAVHAFAIEGHDLFLELLEQVRPGSAAMLPRAAEFAAGLNLTSPSREIRSHFREDSNLSSELLAALALRREAEGAIAFSDRQATLVETLIRLYGAPDSQHLNYYGPSRTITTIPYHSLLSMDAAAAKEVLSGRIVFVGFSEPVSDEQQDDFPTVFSERSGTDLGGVEIGATATANLIDANPVRLIALPWRLAIMLAWGMALTIAVLSLPTRLGVLAVLAAGPLYVYVSLRLFAAAGVWLPLITPVFGQIPLALIGALAWKHAHARRLGERAQRTLESYLPKRAIEELARRVEGAGSSAQLLHGTCLVTDAQNYTALAERLPPRELQKALNAYYGVLFPEVERRGGFVADVVGDSMVAIWATPEPDAAARLNACHAALDIQRATRAFNAANPGFELPTRIGIHAGQILLGDVGTKLHLEYRAIGDIVNTASRIQVLNKQLRTTLLVSEDVLEGAGATSFRRLGEFRLAGKELPIRLCDRLLVGGANDREQALLLTHFDEAHRLFLDRRWAQATASFETFIARFPDDGPGEFFLGLCRHFAVQDPGPGWTGVVAATLP